MDISKRIRSWLADPTNNTLQPDKAIAAFAPPLLGFARGDDPLFTQLAEDIDQCRYWTPAKAHALAFAEEVAASELSVLTWILPQTEGTRLAQRRATCLPSTAWSMARHFGEQVNERLRRQVVSWFSAAGYQACAPVLLPQWTRFLSMKYGYASSWSERHTAHVCGLGTFGLSDGLITPAGKAVRIGSVIVRKAYPATPRPYTSHTQWCLYFSKGKCGRCMQRCPAGAITMAGHDKERCKTYIRSVTAPHVEQEQLGFRVNSCGLCQVAVPCESRIPLAGKNHTGS